MNFWTWFSKDGDKVCNFLSLSSLALMGLKTATGTPLLSQGDLTLCLVVGVLATTAHQSFFPNQPTASASKKE
jgi:hypothetical protein